LRSRQTAGRSIDELARRLLALEPARHHRFVNALLEKVAAGEIPRLMLFEPPGHAKSTYASILYPGYYVGRHPEKQLIAASHTKDLAAQFGRKVRNLFGAQEWPFAVTLAEDSSAQTRFGARALRTDRRLGLGVVETVHQAASSASASGPSTLATS
jgi:hypothetical protein